MPRAFPKSFVVSVFPVPAGPEQNQHIIQNQTCYKIYFIIKVLGTKKKLLKKKIWFKMLGMVSEQIISNPNSDNSGQIIFLFDSGISSKVIK